MGKKCRKIAQKKKTEIESLKIEEEKGKSGQQNDKKTAKKCKKCRKIATKKKKKQAMNRNKLTEIERKNDNK